MKLKGRLALVGVAAGLSVVAGSAGLALAGGPTATAGKAPNAADTTQVRVLKTDAAVQIAQATIDAAEQGGHHVTVVIMDRSGQVRVSLHGDGAGPPTDESAKRKAFTAVSFGQATTALAANAGGTNPSIRDIPGTLFLGGGIPITINGEIVAAIGVGGAPSGALDHQYAEAGLAATR